MKILISGSGGLIGSALVNILSKEGYKITKLVRSENKREENSIYWNHHKKEIDKSLLEGFHTVIHLAGENIASGRWTTEKKGKIRHSRIRGTEFLCKSLIELASPPKNLLCASAIGYYGNRGNEILTEESGPGESFLTGICTDWEKASQIVLEKNIRLINIRIGVVLTPKGGALKKMLPPFKMGAGGILGRGTQYMSWISLDDIVKSISYIINEKSISGPVNLVSPEPVTNREFTKTLGKILNRPTFFPVPSFALRTIFGEMADELLLSSTRAEPKKTD